MACGFVSTKLMNEAPQSALSTSTPRGAGCGNTTEKEDGGRLIQPKQIIQNTF